MSFAIARWMFESFYVRQQLGAIEDHRSKHTIEDQGCSWATPLKIVWLLFVNGVLIRHPIFWEIGHFWGFQKNEAKKVKEKTLAKEKVKGMFKKSHQTTAGHNRGLPQQTYYWRSGLLMDYPLENCLAAVFLFKLGFNKASYILEIRHFENSKRIGLRK